MSENTLTVQLLRSTDLGTYACIANNTHGVTARTFQLDVAGELSGEEEEWVYWIGRYIV